MFLVQLGHMGLIRSHDHDEDDAHLRLPVNLNPKWLLANFSFSSLSSQKYGILSQILLEYAISMSTRVM